ncbi:acetylglutamate kinase [Marinicella sp. W31]|uniref:acetylglutamate kinase n=1 Tax=Marinicella sp. W31 TaxID=3023713 RepID=UPI003756B467
MLHEQKILQQVLEHIGDEPAAKYYLRKYGKQGKTAVIKIGGGVIESELPTLTQSLLLLSRLGLNIVVIHGAGPQIDQALDQRQLPTQRLDGMRITPTEHIAVIAQAIQSAHQQLLRGLSQQRIQTASLSQGVFQCQHLDQKRYGEVGDIEQLNSHEIKRHLNNHQVVVIPCLGHLANGQAVNINADCATRELVWALQPEKVIFVTPTGGLLNADDEVISAIQLSSQYDDLMQQDWVHSGMRLKLEQIHALLKPMDASMSVSMTSARNLVKELFTHRGAGTYIAKGEEIEIFDTISKQQLQPLTQLLEDSFGRSLKSHALTNLPVKSLFMATSGEAAALVVHGIDGMPYLDKFAVTRKAQGRGLAKALWLRLKQEYPQLYWRSRANNSINGWYFQQADVSYKHRNWVGFSYGIEMPLVLPCLQHAFTLEESWL